MERLLSQVLARVVRRGSVVVTFASGTRATFGDGTGEPLEVRFTSDAWQRQIALDPELKLGEAFMEGGLVIERGDIAQLLALLMAQVGLQVPSASAKFLMKLRFLFRRLAQFNPRDRSQKNVAHHYDLDGRLYSLFLDADRQYSCAYFETPDQSLDDAQLAKKRHIAAKLLFDKPDLTALDIGCGWGGMGLYLAGHTGAQVTGVTLSQEQLGVARCRAEERGLAERADFRLQDYRDVPGPFDRIVSVGMFEHVGVGHYDEYFGRVAELLKDDGVALIHSIGRSEGPGITNPWIAKYIFPGGYIPALSEVLPAIERAGLFVTDIEILRLHYAETLKAWRERFLAHREEVERLYDSRFVRMFEFYLASSEMAFRHQGMMIFQIQLAKREGVVPLTRNYIAEAETALRRIERENRPGLRLAGE
ncbi:Cyclopropane-fatty-acyl-phospholipid synthase [Starkeya nomas]|uniref:Cyclopropane-fatty-acyl-phospholipid synthase n=2 Tax=Xanthobacteraceae TaxID=335928 RepID=A0A5S9NJB2_9HYPH|nr:MULTISPECIES: cyclopropane-fatty-acyl-phospholipid synthase family protein [Xanthobacteraceae]TSJ62076.1 class I SAM-dependent methyltransferase [Ancylobacter moscoviensis]CAA0088922.1 Cyclopropane-fatty-acyl-phospholipid synthase [Starkeya nomas]